MVDYVLKDSNINTDALLQHINENAGRGFKMITPVKAEGNTTPFLLDQDYIARFARNDKSREKLAKEARILAFLQGKTGCMIPDVTFYQTRMPFSLHQQIKGERLEETDYNLLSPAAQERFAGDIADFVCLLHRHTPAELAKLKLPLWQRYETFPPPAHCLEHLKNCTFLHKDIQAYLISFCKSYRPVSTTEQDIVFGHCDILPKNIAFDYNSSRLNGIYDFGDSGLIHREYEFSQIALDWPPKLLQAVLSLYGQKTGIDLKAERISGHALYCRISFFIEKRILNGVTTGDFEEKLLSAVERHRNTT